MLGSSGFPMARNHVGDDRFYNPPPMRRQLQQQLQQQQQQQRAIEPRPSAVLEIREAEDRAESDDLKASVCSPLQQPRLPLGNLDQFLEATTPIVPAQYLSKTTMRVRRVRGANHPYFNLGDLWEFFKEWSAYGVGVRLMLNGSDSVVQYYVPYLSGIQLYVDSKSKRSLSPRRPGEESDGDSCRDTSSDGSSDCQVHRSKHINEGAWSHHNPADPSILRVNRLSLREKPPLVAQEGLFCDGEASNPYGLKIFEYLERDPPYSREPLADKISVLARRFSELKTHRSCELLPASWVSVAWYPIYRIPTGPTLRDLDACFLTFHSLSTFSQSTSNVQQQVNSSTGPKVSMTMDTSEKLSLPAFGLASYKFRGSVWTPNGVLERQQATSLLQFADSWLRHLKVDHPDFRFFASHSTYWR